MFKLHVFLFCIYFCVLLPDLVSAITDQEKDALADIFKSAATRCMLSHPISPSDISAFRNKRVPTGRNVPCFLACMLKKLNSLDEDGNLDVDAALEVVKSVVKNPADIKMFSDYLQSCAHVNTVRVSDYKKGCERALLSYRCLLEKADKVQFGSID